MIVSFWKGISDKALYDISGRRVGVYRGERIGEGLRAGVYFLRLEGGGAKPVRIVKVK
jgi:hypothetical protein